MEWLLDRSVTASVIMPTCHTNLVIIWVGSVITPTWSVITPTWSVTTPSWSVTTQVKSLKCDKLGQDNLTQRFDEVRPRVTSNLKLHAQNHIFSIPCKWPGQQIQNHWSIEFSDQVQKWVCRIGNSQFYASTNTTNWPNGVITGPFGDRISKVDNNLHYFGDHFSQVSNHSIMASNHSCQVSNLVTCNLKSEITRMTGSVGN